LGSDPLNGDKVLGSDPLKGDKVLDTGSAATGSADTGSADTGSEAATALRAESSSTTSLPRDREKSSSCRVFFYIIVRRTLSHFWPNGPCTHGGLRAWENMGLREILCFF